MIIFNAVGVLLAGVGLAVAAGVYSLTGPSNAAAYVAGGIAAIAGDAFYRSRRRDATRLGAALSPLQGGQLMFVPIWVAGVAAIGLGAHDYWVCPSRLATALDGRDPEVRARLADAEATMALVTADAAKAAAPVTPADFPVRPLIDVPDGRANVAFVARSSYPGGPLDPHPYGYAKYVASVDGKGCGALQNQPCGGIYAVTTLSEHRTPKSRESMPDHDPAARFCDPHATEQVAQALAMRYIVSEVGNSGVYVVLDIETKRLLGRLEVPGARSDQSFDLHRAAVRQALARQSGGSFDYGSE
jgi:hypothetical protein